MSHGSIPWGTILLNLIPIIILIVGGLIALFVIVRFKGK
jgi:hypothetical protein